MRIAELFDYTQCNNDTAWQKFLAGVASGEKIAMVQPLSTRRSGERKRDSVR